MKKKEDKAVEGCSKKKVAAVFDSLLLKEVRARKNSYAKKEVVGVNDVLS